MSSFQTGGIAAVTLLRAWIDTAAIADGPLFRKLIAQGRLTANL